MGIFLKKKKMTSTIEPSNVLSYQTVARAELLRDIVARDWKEIGEGEKNNGVNYHRRYNE